MSDYAVSRDGRPVKVNEFCSVSGQVSSITGTGTGATVAVKLGSGATVNVQALDVTATAGVIPTTEIA